MKVSNPELRLEIYRSKLSYTTLSRKERNALPLPDAFVERMEDAPTTGLVRVSHDAYLPMGFKPPFRPFQLVQDGQVIASAFLDKAGCTAIYGRLTDRLGELLHTLVTNYARSSNWIGYTWNDEMISFAFQEAMIPALRFDEARKNPFAFLTKNTYFAFLKVLKKEKAVTDRRAADIEVGIHEDQWSLWVADQNESDNSIDAIYDAMCAEMDLLFGEELKRRDSARALPRQQKFQIGKLSPVSSAAIKYGLSIGLTGQAIAHHFGLDVATVSRVKNDVTRS